MLFTMQEEMSGRIHIICKPPTGKTFYDLIVKDRTKTTGSIEEVTSYEVNQFETIEEYQNFLMKRPLFNAMPINDPTWLGKVIQFIFQ